MSPPGRAGDQPSADSSIGALIAKVRAGMNLRDGYYLREELADLYLVGVLRGMEVGLREAISEPGGDTASNHERLAELVKTSEELLNQLNRSRSP
ncbi:MAG TPA: hypothetical protein VGH99_03420 [Pseudonocardia sp.]